MRPWLLLAALLAACGPYVGPTAGMGWRWRHEPSVGVSSPELAAPAARAVERWGYGTLLPSCRGADICIIPGPASHAGPVGDRCVAYVETEAWYVVAHELGHCYGLPHSPDPASVMHWYSAPGQDVTDEDRAALARADT